MAQILYTPNIYVVDDDGNPVNGALVYTYDAGTSTPRTTWSDAGETTPNANPIVCNSRGEALAYGTGEYKLVATYPISEGGATIWTRDNIKVSGSVDTNDIVDGAVTTPKLADNALSANVAGRAKMQDGFVTSAKLDTNGVTLPNNSAATTQSVGDNTTKVATTAFVQAEFTDKTASVAEMEAASSTTDFVTPGRQSRHPLHPKGAAYIDTTTPATPVVTGLGGVSSCTRNAVGDYTVTLSDTYTTGPFPFVSVRNGTSRTVVGITAVTSNSFTILVQLANAAGGADPSSGFYVQVFGDI